MDDQPARIAALLQRPARRITSCTASSTGTTRTEASWYAQWLLDLSELPQILTTTPVRNELVWMLVSLDKEYTTTSPDMPWPQSYADGIIEHFGSAGG